MQSLMSYIYEVLRVKTLLPYLHEVLHNLYCRNNNAIYNKDRIRRSAYMYNIFSLEVCGEPIWSFSSCNNEV